MTPKARWLALVLVPVGLIMCTAVLAAEQADDGDEEGEVKVQLKDCPEAVQKTIKKEAGDGKIVEVEKEREHGKTVYEAEVIIDGQEYELTVAEDGELLGKEKEGDEEEGDDDDDDKKDDAK